MKKLSVFSPASVLAGTFCLLTVSVSFSQEHPSLSEAKNYVVPNKLEPQTVPVPLESVRITSGPFLQAQEKTLKLLLDTDPKRLLAWFHKNAGLQPQGEVYGGWERDGIAGHSLGHYMSACAQMYASTDDAETKAELKKRIEYIVDELARCQKAEGERDAFFAGYTAAIPDGHRVFTEIRDKNIRTGGFDLNGLWVPWYTLHKQLAGLLDIYKHLGNQKALSVACGIADFSIRATENLDDELWQQMMNCEFGGVGESFAELYAYTGEKKYLDLANKFYHKAVLAPLAANEDKLAGRHSNTQIPKIVASARIAELLGEKEPLGKTNADIARNFWDIVVDHHTYANGGNSEREYLAEPDKLSDRLSEATCET
ncbi:MAG: beta-L-arabinofuranosidase domain-containing protein, partial [Thermoguttaceae bacterium]